VFWQGRCDFKNQNLVFISTALKNLISNYTIYNQWANTKFVHWLSSLEEELLTRETLSSFNKIEKTIQHIITTQKFWMDFVEGKDLSNFNWSVCKRAVTFSLEEMISNSKEMTERLGVFTEIELETVLHLNTPWANNKQPRYGYIMHLINHGTFHRGQIVTMARVLGWSKGFQVRITIFSIR